MVTIKELTKGIRTDLQLDEQPKQITESYVTQPKEYRLNTELLSDKAKAAHLELYRGYIAALNGVSMKLDTADRRAADVKASSYRALKSAEIFNRNAVYLHELYFANISDVESEVSNDSMSYMRLSRDWGTFDEWQWDFIACANSAGNGWAVMAYDTYLRRYVNFFIDEHDVCIPVGCYPLIVIDMWEHAYYKDYVTNKEQYLHNMMRELNWQVIEERIERAEGINKVLT